jgi:hypothetical protein
MIDRWLNVPENQKELSDLKGEIDPQIIRAETLRRIKRLRELSDQVFSEFIKLL